MPNAVYGSRDRACDSWWWRGEGTKPTAK